MCRSVATARVTISLPSGLKSDTTATCADLLRDFNVPPDRSYNCIHLMWFMWSLDVVLPTFVFLGLIFSQSKNPIRLEAVNIFSAMVIYIRPSLNLYFVGKYGVCDQFHP